MIPEQFAGRACKQATVYSGGLKLIGNLEESHESLVAPEILFDFTGRDGGSRNNKSAWRYRNDGSNG